MNGKTVLRFSENILREIPSMAGDATHAFIGDACAWIHTSERVLEAVGSTITMCIQHHSIRKLSEEVQAEERSMQKQLNYEEATAMEKNREILLKMQDRMRTEREKLEQIIADEEKITEKILNHGIDLDDIDCAITRDTEEIIKSMRETATMKNSVEEAKARKERKQMELLIAKKRYTIEIKKKVRSEIKKAIDLFDKKIKTNPILKELPHDARLRLDEQYRLLMWQYNNNFDI